MIKKWLKKEKMNYNSIIIEYQKITNLLDNTLNQPTKFWTKTLVGINDESCGTYNTKSQIGLKTSLLRSNLCDQIISIKKLYLKTACHLLVAWAEWTTRK